MRTRLGVHCERQAFEGQSPSQYEQVELPAAMICATPQTFGVTCGVRRHPRSCDREARAMQSALVLPQPTETRRNMENLAIDTQSPFETIDLTRLQGVSGGDFADHWWSTLKT